MGAFIVLIEPNPLHAKLFSDLVRVAGHHCVTALSGKEGLSIAAASHPDLIILDLVLPDCDGRDLILALRRDVRTINIPIMILTAADDINNEYECFAFGATAFVGKPVHLSKLRGYIENVVSMTVSRNMTT